MTNPIIVLVPNEGVLGVLDVFSRLSHRSSAGVTPKTSAKPDVVFVYFPGALDALFSHNEVSELVLRSRCCNAKSALIFALRTEYVRVFPHQRVLLLVRFSRSCCLVTICCTLSVMARGIIINIMIILIYCLLAFMCTKVTPLSTELPKRQVYLRYNSIDSM